MTPVLHVVPSVAARDGGPSAAVAGMCRALEDQGVPTLVVTTDADGAGRLDVPIDETTTFSGMRVRFFPCQFSERLKYSGPLGAWVRAHVTEFAAVHVHAVFSHASIAAGRASRRAGMPYVIRPLGSIDPWSLAHHPGRKRALMWLGARALLSGASRVHYTADEERRRAEGALPWLPTGVVIPLGVDDALFDDISTTESRWQGPALVLARLDPKKGIDLAIRAFHQLAGRFPERRLVIAGDGDPSYVRELRALASDGPGGDRIEFRGWVEGADRVRVLGSASVFVLPSAQENFGLSMVEAMAVGTPVVVTRTVDLAARIEERRAGWVVNRSVASVGEALSDSFSNPDECRARGARARRLAETYRWRHVGSQLKALYAEMNSLVAQ
jgi:glycosyltransferase involved in cell wall biosynthesis